MTPNYILKKRAEARKWRKKALKYKIKALMCLLKAKQAQEWYKGK